jgi:heme exporter protein B
MLHKVVGSQSTGRETVADLPCTTLAAVKRRSNVAMFSWIVRREVTLAWKRRMDTISTLFFFMIVVTLFPLSLGPETELLRSIAPGIVWVAALLASMLSLSRLFAGDYVDGTLEQMLLTPQPLYLIVLGKTLAQWVVTGIPLILMSPLIAVQFGLSSVPLATLAASLLLGVPVLSLVGSIGAALTLGLRGSGILLSLLVLPLYIPTLIFGAGAVEATLIGRSPEANIYVLGAVFVVTIVFAPWATCAALRISLE